LIYAILQNFGFFNKDEKEKERERLKNTYIYNFK